MKKTFNILSIIALSLVILGAVNWLLVGIFTFNLVTWITFGMVWLERALYILVGIAGLYMLVWLLMSRGRMVDESGYNSYDKTRYNQTQSNPRTY